MQNAVVFNQAVLEFVACFTLLAAQTDNAYWLNIHPISIATWCFYCKVRFDTFIGCVLTVSSKCKTQTKKYIPLKVSLNFICQIRLFDCLA